MKHVQIPMDLFTDLVKYHALDDDFRDPELESRIRKSLMDKLDALVRHEVYTQSKIAPTPAEREQARQRYLDAIGVPASFRW